MPPGAATSLVTSGGHTSRAAALCSTIAILSLRRRSRALLSASHLSVCWI
jgi:hypothetical protein